VLGNVSSILVGFTMIALGTVQIKLKLEANALAV
jgi:hypothetical protein